MSAPFLPIVVIVAVGLLALSPLVLKRRRHQLLFGVTVLGASGLVKSSGRSNTRCFLISGTERITPEGQVASYPASGPRGPGEESARRGRFGQGRRQGGQECSGWTPKNRR